MSIWSWLGLLGLLAGLVGVAYAVRPRKKKITHAPGTFLWDVRAPEDEDERTFNGESNDRN